MNGTPQAPSMEQTLSLERPLADRQPWRPSWLDSPLGSESSWAIAFVVPYVAVFVGFVAYPVCFGLWMGSKPQLYAELAADPLYLNTVVNTLLFVGIGVNLKMFLAFLLSGFFMGRSRWIRSLLVLYMLPWALPAVPAFLAFHWMLIGHWGFLDSLLYALFGIDGPIWFNSYWLAMGANIVAYIWKWMPFWTLIFLAGRMAIPRDVYEAAEIDGATAVQRFAHVTVPLLANLYLICVMLSAAWTLGDFTTVYFVSGGAPALSTEVLATLGFRNAFTVGDPRLGVATVMSALPLLIPLVIMLVRRVRTTEVQL
jgi:multiple sugar transport system permease protein